MKSIFILKINYPINYPLTESDKKIVNSSSDFENFKNNGKSFKNVRSVDKYIFYQIAKQKLL